MDFFIDHRGRPLLARPFEIAASASAADSARQPSREVGTGLISPAALAATNSKAPVAFEGRIRPGAWILLVKHDRMT